MDALGRKGAIFLNNFVPATETYASIPLILSSRYYSNPIFQMDTWEWGLKRENPQTIFNRFDDQQILLPAFLSAHGYHTAMFHNHPWFVDRTELNQAFDESFIFPTANRGPIDGRMVDAVLSWIAKHRDDRFFIYYHIMSPHQPYPPKDEDLDFVSKEKLPDLDRTREKFNRRASDNSTDWTPEEIALYSVMYDSNLKHSDSQIGRLYEGIEKLGQAEKTMFIITSDHGELLGQHGRLGHGDFLPWESLVHVPLIMIWPGKIPAAVRINGLTESIDIFPTIADICGLELPPEKVLDGVSQKKLLKKPKEGRKAVYIKGSVRTPEYKFYIDRSLLFEIQKNPEEKVNISDSKPVQFKRQLRDDYNTFMEPYKERHLRSVRQEAPDYPFYFPINEFSMSPAKACKNIATEQSAQEFLRQYPQSVSWLLNTSNRQGYLICLPENGPPPHVTLSCRLPAGAYHISVLISPLIKSGPIPKKGDFKARIDASGQLCAPDRIRPVSAYGPGYYLEYEPAVEIENDFSIELQFQPPRKETYLVRHVAFTPVHSPEKHLEPADSAAAEKRKNDLRALGYAQ